MATITAEIKISDLEEFKSLEKRIAELEKALQERPTGEHLSPESIIAIAQSIGTLVEISRARETYQGLK